MHSKGGGKTGGVVVDAVEGQINDDAWPAVALGDDSNWGESKVWEVADKAIGEDGPKTLTDKIGHFGAEEVVVFVGRGMAAASHHTVEVFERPRGGVRDGRGTVEAEVVEELGGGMLESSEAPGELGGPSGEDDELVPIDGGEEGSSRSSNELT